MPKLVDLRVELDINERYWRDWNIEELDAVRMVRVPGRFELTLPQVVAKRIVGGWVGDGTDRLEIGVHDSPR